MSAVSFRPGLGARIDYGSNSDLPRGRGRALCRCDGESSVANAKATAKRVIESWDLLQSDSRRPGIAPPDWETQCVRPAILVTPGGSLSGQAHVGLAIFSAIEKLVDRVVKRPARTFANDPEIQLCGNFAPVDECPPVSGLEVVGSLPQCLDGGVYLRNGPNPRIFPESDYHNFDGDGMLHAVSFKDGEQHMRAVLLRLTRSCCVGRSFPQSNCWVAPVTRFLQEHKIGQALFVKSFGEAQGMRGLLLMALQTMKAQLGILNTSDGFGTANAGLAFHHDKLLAISEIDLPYAVKVGEDGEIFTLGRHTFDGKLKLSMTAHPKIDPQTGEMFCYTYDVLVPPYLKYFWVSADGVKQRDVHITFPGPVLIHDFAITDNYTIFPETSIRFSLLEMMKGNPCVAPDENKVPRFGVLPKYAKDGSQMKWFTLPDSTCFHYYNAWEEGEEVIMCASVLSPVSNIFNNPKELFAKPSEIRLNMKTGEVSLRQIANVDLDVGTINERFRGRKNRYAYLSTSGPWPKFSGIAKLDLQAPKYSPPVPQQLMSDISDDSAIVGSRKVPGCFTSEPWFVPRTTDSEAAEDDGYVLAFSHNEITDQSELLVLDAQSPTLDQVACVKIPSRVPYGFHGIFLTKEQVAQL